MKLLNKIAKRFGFVPAKAGRRNYGGAASNRILADWTSSSQSEDAAVRNSLSRMRDRVRQLCRDDDYAKKFLNLVEANIVGHSGIVLQMQAVDVRPSKDGLVKTSDTLANDLIEEAWAEFSLPENFTVTGKISRQQAEGLSVKTTARDGEFLCRLIRDARVNRFGFALQFLEVDQLDHLLNTRLENGNVIRMGVELDAWNKPVAYHLFERNPGDDLSYSADNSRRLRIPADEIIHGFLPTYFQQTRGVTWYHTCMSRLQILGGYEEAVLVHARAAAAKMGFIIQKSENATDYQGDGEDNDGNLVTEAEPGVVEKLPYGHEFQSWDASQPNAEFSQFRKAILRGVSSGLGVNYNSLGSDLEGVNYSSIRAGVIEERDQWKVIQGWFINTFERRIFTEWLKMALLSGAIPLPASKFDKFNRPRFIARRWPWVDPLKDIKAAREAIAARVKTRGQIIAEEGGDFEEVIREFEREDNFAAAHGVTLEEQPTESEEEEPEEK